MENGGKPPAFDTRGKSYCLDQLATYHWNGGNGNNPGTISLVGGGTTLGPYKAVGSGGTGRPVDWIATATTPAQPVVINGRYTCRDSNPSTWAQNQASGGHGYCRVFVRAAQVDSVELSGTLSVPGAQQVRVAISVGGTRTVGEIRLDLIPLSSTPVRAPP